MPFLKRKKTCFNKSQPPIVHNSSTEPECVPQKVVVICVWQFNGATYLGTRPQHIYRRESPRNAYAQSRYIAPFAASHYTLSMLQYYITHMIYFFSTILGYENHSDPKLSKLIARFKKVVMMHPSFVTGYSCSFCATVTILSSVSGKLIKTQSTS